MQPAEQLKIDTPEQIALELAVAGIGSRFLAIAVDTVLQLFLYLAGFIVLAFFQLPAILRPSLGFLGPALVILFGFSVYWGYFAFFEILWSGRTPGKRLAGIRVIKDTGRPITALEAIGRNILRAIDFMPVMYGVGVACMMLNRNSRRIGDFVAGTIVVHDKQTENVRLAWPTEGDVRQASVQLAAMSADELELIETYLHRRLDLDPVVRRNMAEQIVTRIDAKSGVRPETGEDIDDFLEAVARQIRDTARFR